MLNESLPNSLASSFYNFDRYHFICDCLIPYGIFVAAYFAFATPFTFIDLFGCPEILRKYKTRPDENLITSFQQLKKCVKGVLFNFIFIGLPLECLIYFARVKRGCHNDTGGGESKYPWFLTLPIEMLLMQFLFSIIFFYSHCFLHSPKVYKHSHKIHHEWKPPISMSTFYAHPIDHFFVNWLDVALPALLIGADATTITVWYTSVVFVEILQHSGFKHPFWPIIEYHDYHHANFTKNFGVHGFLGLYLDRLYGTEALLKSE